MPKRIHTHLSRRETQIMDIVYRAGEASVAGVLEKMEDPPGYNSVRVILRILEEKGYLTHRQEGQRYVYQPTVAHERAVRSALSHLLDTFFEGSAPAAVATLLEMSPGLDQAELDELAVLIDQAREQGNEP